MTCILMHRTIPVVQIDLDDVSGEIREVGELFSKEHLPVGVSFDQDHVNRADLYAWWTDRSIPASRSGLQEALETLEIPNTRLLLLKCYGLSLSDQYWIRPVNSDLTWNKINFFENAFSDDIGDVLFGAKKKANALDFSSPDNTSEGNLKKRWKIIDGKRCLIKGGSTPFRQEPFNEVIAAGIAKRLGIPHVNYSVVLDNGAPYSVCEDFVTTTTELIPAWRIQQILKKSSNESAYQHFVSCSKQLGIPNVVPFLDRMLVFDFLIANEDRHLNNFGAIRNAETLAWIGMAPIYDSGSSLGFNKLTKDIHKALRFESKPFIKDPVKQLKLVQDFSWIDFHSLANSGELVKAVLSSDEANDFIDPARIEAIADAVNNRIELLKAFCK